MVEVGGPCEAPGKEPGTLCGRTEIPDKCDWGHGKEEHVGKICCTKRKCRLALKVIQDTAAKKAKADAAPASTGQQW